MQEAELYRLVQQKQVHKCNDYCLENNVCTKGFPHEVNGGPASQHAISGRWRYPCAAEADRNIVPYHARCLLLWGAHMNLQRVADADFSWYMVKYTTKASCSGALDLSGTKLVEIAFPRLAVPEQHVVAAYANAQVVSPCEAAVDMLGEALLIVPNVRYVFSGVPTRASRAPHVQQHTTPLDLYLDRPAYMDGLTFIDFHTRFTHKAADWDAAAPSVGSSRGGARALCFLPCTLV